VRFFFGKIFTDCLKAGFARKTRHCRLNKPAPFCNQYWRLVAIRLSGRLVELTVQKCSVLCVWVLRRMSAAPHREKNLFSADRPDESPAFLFSGTATLPQAALPSKMSNP
jgi:hypothetical protein